MATAMTATKMMATNHMWPSLFVVVVAVAVIVHRVSLILCGHHYRISDDSLTLAHCMLLLGSFSFDPTERLTFWSTVIGGLFSTLGIFGVGQSSVQRYCALPTLRQAQR